MGKFITGIFATLGIILLTCMTLLFGKAVYNEYLGDGNSTYRQHTCTCDSINIPMSYQDYTFLTIEDATSTQIEFQREDYFVSTYRLMPTETLQNVCSMLFKQKRQCDIISIVTEYENNKNMYDSMKPNSIIREDTPEDPVPLGQQVTTNVVQTPPDSVIANKLHMRALILFYNGHEVSNEVLTHIIKDCVTIGMISEASTCEVYQLSESDMAKALATSIRIEPSEDVSAIDNALFIIKTSFGDMVKQPAIFKMQLLGMCLAVKHNPELCTEEIKGVYQAVITLGSVKNIPGSLKEKYNIDNSLLKVISQVKDSCYV